MAYLCINAGSSSLKCALYDGSVNELRLLASSLSEGVGLDHGGLTILDGDGRELHRDEEPITDHGAALHAVLDALEAEGQPVPVAIGHRIVHGGPDLVAHTVIDGDVRRQLDAAREFAPLHLPAELAGIDAATQRFASAPQVACFDTAFHRTLPEVASTFALPPWVRELGVRRYGFHGLSCEYLVGALGAETLGRGIIAHLGSGASLTAIVDGRSVDTTMGFTPTGGVVMATRTGDLDPGVLVYLARERGLGADELERLVDHDSGLLGLSGSTPDLRALVERRDDDPLAALAIDCFCYSTRKAIGALTTALGGLDSLTFTAGIGEHAPTVRAQICAGLGHLGIDVDPSLNDAAAPVISPAGSAVVVRVVATDENLVIARHTVMLSRR